MEASRDGLAKAGLRTQVRLDPILPGLTDDEDKLRPLVKAIAETGVKKVAASILLENNIGECIASRWLLRRADLD